MAASSDTLRTNAHGKWSPPWNRLSRRPESARTKRAGHRGTLSCRRAGVCLLFTTILLSLWNATAAHAQYVQRQVLTTNGAVTFVGNALGLNKEGTLDRPGASGSLGTFITTDTSQQENPDWPQGTTGDWRLNRSSAVLSLPLGSRIIYAELVWGGSYPLAMTRARALGRGRAGTRLCLARRPRRPLPGRGRFAQGGERRHRAHALRARDGPRRVGVPRALQARPADRPRRARASLGAAAPAPGALRGTCLGRLRAADRVEPRGLDRALAGAAARAPQHVRALLLTPRRRAARGPCAG